MNYKEYMVKVSENGDIRWFKPGTDIVHREGGPAAEFAIKNKLWYIDGKLHRLDGTACEYNNGDTAWFFEGKRHRLGGPAQETNGNKFWYKDGQAHREDGPAFEYANGDKYWYFEGKELTEEQFNNRNKLSCEGKVVEIDGVKYKLTEIK